MDIDIAWSIALPWKVTIEESFGLTSRSLQSSTRPFAGYSIALYFPCPPVPVAFPVTQFSVTGCEQSLLPVLRELSSLGQVARV